MRGKPYRAQTVCFMRTLRALHVRNKAIIQTSVFTVCSNTASRYRQKAATPTESHEDEEVSGSLGFGFMQICMTQKSRYEGLNQDWISLDTQSNVDIFCNKELLTNVRKIPGPGLHLRSNSGTMIANMVGDIPNYGTVWYHHRSLANILSFANVRKRFSVTVTLVRLLWF